MDIKGQIKIVATNVKTGKVVDVFEENNLVVNGGRVAAAALINGDFTDNAVTQIGFGASGVNPALTDTDLTGKFIKDLAGGIPSGDGSIIFSFSLDEEEANGMAIQEMGLFTAGGVLFARKNRSVINKTADIRFDGTWTIKF